MSHVPAIRAWISHARAGRSDPNGTPKPPSVVLPIGTQEVQATVFAKVELTGLSRAFRQRRGLLMSDARIAAVNVSLSALARSTGLLLSGESLRCQPG